MMRHQFVERDQRTGKSARIFFDTAAQQYVVPIDPLRPENWARYSIDEYPEAKGYALFLAAQGPALAGWAPTTSLGDLAKRRLRGIV